MVNLSIVTRYNQYMNMAVEKSQVLDVSDEEFEALPKSFLICVWLKHYTDHNANIFLKTATSGWGPNGLYFPFSPLATHFAKNLSPDISPKVRMMLIMEHPEVTNNEIASIGF